VIRIFPFSTLDGTPPALGPVPKNDGQTPRQRRPLNIILGSDLCPCSLATIENGVAQSIQSDPVNSNHRFVMVGEDLCRVERRATPTT
jgi:hypothetical protein